MKYAQTESQNEKNEMPTLVSTDKTQGKPSGKHAHCPHQIEDAIWLQQQELMVVTGWAGSAQQALARILLRTETQTILPNSDSRTRISEASEETAARRFLTIFKIPSAGTTRLELEIHHADGGQTNIPLAPKVMEQLPPKSRVWRTLMGLTEDFHQAALAKTPRAVPLEAADNPKENTYLPPYLGTLDPEIHSGCISGWAVRCDQVHEAVKIDILVDGHIVAQAIAHRHHDKTSAELQTLRAHFSIPLQEMNFASVPKSLTAHTLRAHISNTPWALGGEVSIPPQHLLDLKVQKQRNLDDLPAARQRLGETVPKKTRTEGAKIIAFYLPQFHPIPENDEWWGQGFTEWTNVTRARPLFDDHHQPQLPADLGYYDLRLPEVRHAQAKLAESYGIHGFCFHYYWFSGRRLLERPLFDALADKSYTMPFCICWANENWSRRWDGSENEILVQQRHSLENDVRFVEDAADVLADPRYIRVDGKPLLVIYRAGLLKDPKLSTHHMRRRAQELGLGGLHLVMAQTFDNIDPREYGFDAAVQFPPHRTGTSRIQKPMPGTVPGFSGNVYDYEDVVECALREEEPDYIQYPGVMPGWDNTARRKKRGHVYTNPSPKMYQVWLRDALRRVKKYEQEQQWVFVNAWNEWAEGAHLEPDLKDGHAYLEATRKALSQQDEWPTIVAHARALSAKENPALSECIDLLENRLQQQDRAHRFLNGRGAFVRSFDGTALLSPHQPSAFLGLPERNSGLSHVDSANQYEFLDGATFSNDTQLTLKGWSYSAAPLNRWSQTYVIFEHLEDETRYYAPVLRRYQRDGMLGVFGGVPDSCLEYAGFEIDVALKSLKAGQYQIHLVHPFPEDHALYYSTPKGHITVLS